MHRKGIFCTALSALLFGVTPLLGRLTYGMGSNALTLTFYRNALVILPIFLLLRLRKISLRISPRQLATVLAVGILGRGFTTLMLYDSYRFVGIGIATTLHFLYPVFVAVLCRVVFHDRLGRVRLAALVLAGIGVLCFLERDSGPVSGAGLALATILSQAVSAVWVLAFLTGRKSRLKIRRRHLRLDPKVLLPVAAIGVSPFIMQSTESLVNIALNSSLKHYGSDTFVGAMTIASSVMQVLTMPFMGLSQGAQPIIGYNHGAMKPGRVLLTLKYGVLAGTSFTTLGFLACVFFPRGIAGLFTDDASLISLAANGLIICVLAFPLIGSQIIIGNFFQAIGKARLAIFLSLTRQMLFLLPFLLVLPRFWGQDGVWASLPLADVLSFIVTLLFIRRFLKYYRLKNRHYLVPGTGKA